MLKSDYIKPETRAYAHKLASKRDKTSLLLKGNAKTGYIGTHGYLFRTKGLPVHDCPDSTESCRSACYALLDPMFNLEKNVGVGHIYSWLAHDDMMSLYDQLRQEIIDLMANVRIKQSGLVIRIHEAGDFINALHVAIYHWLALEFRDVHFFGYSRGFANASIRLALYDINQLPNVLIRESLDDSRSKPCGDAPGAFFGADDNAPSRYFRCIEQITKGTVGHKKCIDCGLCWTQRKISVRFIQH